MTKKENPLSPLSSRSIYDHTDEARKILDWKKDYYCERCKTLTISKGNSIEMYTQVIVKDNGEAITYCRPCWKHIHPKAHLELIEENIQLTYNKIESLKKELLEFQKLEWELAMRILHKDEMCECELNE